MHTAAIALSAPSAHGIRVGEHFDGRNAGWLAVLAMDLPDGALRSTLAERDDHEDEDYQLLRGPPAVMHSGTPQEG